MGQCISISDKTTIRFYFKEPLSKKSSKANFNVPQYCSNSTSATKALYTIRKKAKITAKLAVNL